MTKTLELLERLVAFPTVSHRSNLDLINWAQVLLSDAGFDVTRILSPNKEKAGLFAQIGPKIKGGICLSAHTDVVPTEGQEWTSDPFQLKRDGGRVIGRGATDMKGFVASVLAIAKQAKTAPLKFPLSVILSYDEEVGCVGIRDMLPELGPMIGQPKLVIVGEPTSMQIATGHKGKGALRVTCTGEAGHSALAPKFVNAIRVATRFVDEVVKIQEDLAKGPNDHAYDIPYSTTHIGKIEGGRTLNIVPDHVALEMEFRHLPDLPANEILGRIIRAARQIEDYYSGRTSVAVEQVNAYPGLEQSTDTPAIKWAKSLAQESTTTKVAFGTEAGFFAELGLDTIVLGPGDMATDGHKPDEAITLEQLNACDVMMGRILQSLR